MTAQLVQDVVPAEDFARLARQQVQQVELRAGQLHHHAVALYAAARGVDGQTLKLQRARGNTGPWCPAPAQHRLQARHQFTWLEGLGQIVVRPQLQPHHTVHHLAACGQHHDGQVALLADGAAQLEAVHFRQHDVEDGSVEAAGRQLRQAIAGPKGVHELQLKTLEVSGQGRAQLRVVVNQQYAVHEQFSHRQARSPRGSSTEAPAAHNAR